MKERIPYAVRESTRARHVSLRVSVEKGLVVIVPPGFDRRLIAQIIQAKRGWVERQMRRVEEERSRMAAHPLLYERFPEQVALLAIDQTWRVLYRDVRGASEVRLAETAASELTLSGRIRDAALCGRALRAWLRRQGRRHLVPWAERLADELGVSVARISIRGQKTRWGSFSTRGTLSLNYKLLFLPAPWVNLVLVHELCHSRVMNHSPEFWRLVGRIVPEYRTLRRAMRDAWTLIPRWAYGQ